MTAHNDIARTGQNLNETILTPANVNSNQFGKLFTHPISGQPFAQPLYVPQVAIPGKGVHNVVYVVTSADYVYAFDADNNGGANAAPLWSTFVLTNTAPAGTYTQEFGIQGTPVIDPATKTMYLVSSEEPDVFRLHALDITTGKEKFGGPEPIVGRVDGTGSGSANGLLTFDPGYHRQRAGLLLLNGVLYVPFGSVNDNGPWHGWIFSYNAATLALIDTFCTSPNGTAAGIWMGGAALAAEVDDPAKPYGRMFFSTGNGAYAGSVPYSNGMSFGMSVLDLDLTGGMMTVKDSFTPHNWAALSAQDADLGAGGTVLLPAEKQASGTTLNSLVAIGKSGKIYILNRNNLGGYSPTSDNVVQALQTPQSGEQNWGAGVWGASAYYNQHIYFGGINPGVTNGLAAYSYVNGVLSSAPTSQTTEQFAYPGPTPSISANGASNGIVWALKNDANGSGPAVLLAFNANNVTDLLYSSNTNLERDNPGLALKFAVPTIANGKVYVAEWGSFSTFGLLGTIPTVATPVITPPGDTFNGSQRVSITSATPGAQIYYTTDGTTPTINSHIYTGPLTVTETETITAIANATGYLQGQPATATFYSAANAANPVFSLAGGTYSGSQSVAITDRSKNAVIHYTVDGSTPTTASAVYTTPIHVPVTETVQALATAPGLQPSSIVTAFYDIDPPYLFNFNQGFAQAQALGQMQFNGSTDLDDFRLQLTNGGFSEAGSAFYTKPVNIQSFTTDFTFQQSNPNGDGFTFTIQNNSAAALGGDGGSLGYAGIGKSVAIKFDLFSNSGEGPNSTGLYINGAQPTAPAVSLVNTPINLHSADYTTAHITYDGTNLTITLTDTITLGTWSHSFAVNIPAIVGGNTAYVGFTGGSGGLSSSQKVTSWTYFTGQPPYPNYPTGFHPTNMVINGTGGLSGTSLQLTNGGLKETTSAFYAIPVGVESFTSNFQFLLTKATADGFAFVIQNAGPHAIGTGGGGLGYASIPNSVAIKWDFFNNAGEGNDSTGVYVNGAMPTLPCINLAPTGFLVNDGDLIGAQIDYDGTTLEWTIFNLTQSTRGQITERVAIDIPHTIGSNTAYVGFTGASGGETAIQNILNWTVTNP
ncbi:hypothetical protein ACPOL_3635 [Acidisarcina polymorpha]|uniref:Uncharacterized protein n=1 Tax=Acidisarcina polymorpha TaxID=2211140 RepID=A0A2Z5G1G1_9BACT|nr:hypothetical protein ACPOL_3635 [Acidisarcina polymorpha]